MVAANGLPEAARTSQPVWRKEHNHLPMLVASMTCLEDGGILPPHVWEPLCCGDLEGSSHQIVLVEDMICLGDEDILQQHADSREHFPSWNWPVSIRPRALGEDKICLVASDTLLLPDGGLERNYLSGWGAGKTCLVAEGVLLSSELDCCYHGDVQADNHPLMLGEDKTYQVDVNAHCHLPASCPCEALVHNHPIELEEDRTYLAGESILDLYDSHAQYGLQTEHNHLKALVGGTLFLEDSYIPPFGGVLVGWMGSIRPTSLVVGRTCSEGACTLLLGDAVSC